MEKEKKFEGIEKDCKFKGRYPAEKRCIKTENLQHQKVGSCALEFCPELMPAKPEEEESVAIPEDMKLGENSPKVEEKKKEEKEDVVGRTKTPVETVEDFQSSKAEGHPKNKIVTNQTEGEK